jgi:glycosyltransferase involved in cell wall biosynthesis
MKILLLSDTNSEHTEKWALGLAEKGCKVGLFSFNRASYEWYDHENITVYFEPEKQIHAEKRLTKLAYIKHIAVLKKIIKHFQPDILHAHYATSYGLVGALSGFHPFVISSWGTDVMKFPQKNIVARSILKHNFKSADLLCATSHVIESYIHEVINKPVKVIPFGVNIDDFKPRHVKSLFAPEHFVIGSVKPLEPLYNIDVLIKAFRALSLRFDHIRLLIIGSGTEENSLKKLCGDLEIQDKVIFTGRVPFHEVSNYFNMINALANLSEYESFGVSVIEAMACGLPVVVSDVGGLSEVVSDDSVGLKVPAGSVEETLKMLEKLILNKDLCKTIGENARDHVIKHYNWEDNLDTMISEYKKLLK